MSSHSDGQEDESGLGQLRHAQNHSACLAIGTLVIYTPEKESISNEDVSIGSIGVIIEYSDGWQKHLQGMEPVEVLFSDGIHRVYVDELGVVK